ncbi:hypothetical protein [Helicobacter felis]|uniref:Uncharacterized protein n=1 Tax=Helicobacter felis (strain ATCC 49179 / CCUG 28539 / NCTC 12436 / CS1) TaxID=936155 RepID=E7AAU7_HELFC|nr:hypothetical protein [Helicobacter felis]CBY82768.1 unnamed protein product [Helicobacter felis ATCC 49179]
MQGLFSLKNAFWVWLVAGLFCLNGRDTLFYDPSCDEAWNLVFPDEDKNEDDKKTLRAPR